MLRDRKPPSYYIMLIVTYGSALGLLMMYMFIYIPPKTMGVFAGFSLVTPVLIGANLLLIIYWGLNLKRLFWLPFVVLLVGYSSVKKLYKFKGKKVILSEDIKLMSYNVRLFNNYKWTEQKNIPIKIPTFIAEKDPDVLCVQEYGLNNGLEELYPYKFEKLKRPRAHVGHAIFSKYPIINKGSFDFENTGNNILYADINIGKDTIRVYNLHLQSIRLNLDKQYFGEKDAKKLNYKISKVFQLQQEQVEQLLKHQKQCKHPVVLMGDFNNTAFSWVYKKLKEGKRDAFVAAGSGFDPTYNHHLPLRIDFILVDKRYEVEFFKTYKIPYSDHNPILARIHRK